MAKGNVGLCRTARFGVFVVGLMLALSVPVMAFAATASFSSKSPAAGSSTTNRRPTISVVVYDRYGVSGSSNYSLTVDSVKRTTVLARFSGWGLRRFRLSFTPTSDLQLGLNTVTARVHDARHHTSTTTWTFNVIDNVPPVTTTDAHLNYVINEGAPVLPTIGLTATDAGGSDVAHTYYILDKSEGGTQLTYTVPSSIPSAGTTPMLHSLEYWSVDNAGNIETHHVFYFFVQLTPRTFAQNHESPTSLGLECTLSGCHNSDLWTIHSGSEAATTVAGIEYVGCALCHNTNPGMPLTTNNCTTCHGVLHHGDHIAIPSAGTDPAGTCTTTACHGSLMLVTHSLHGCATCHDSANALVAAAVEGTGATCETCHGPAAGALFPAHDNPNHQVTTANGCIAAAPFCHTMHPAGDATHFHPTCWACHNTEEMTTPIDCVTSGCHEHSPVLTQHLQPVQHKTLNTCASGNAPGCHPDNVALIHGNRPLDGCPDCHANVSHDASTDCAVCHPAGLAVHNTETLAAANAAHVNWDSFACVSAGCHSDDVGNIHGGGISAPRPGCADCHKAGTVLPTQPAPIVCAQCHAAFVGVAHYPQPSDTTRSTHHLNAGATCTTCHDRVTGIISCGTAGCHTGTVVGTTVTRSNATTYTATDLPAEFALNQASRHNVAEFGGTSSTGAKTRFNGSQGVTLTWLSTDATTVVGKDAAALTQTTFTVGQTGTVTSAWEFPTINVFWKSTDASAPPTAIKGLTKDSVISCLDCHISPQGAVGPHGSTYKWLIDPNYPGDYSYAVLTKYVTANLAYASDNAAKTQSTILDAARYAAPLSVSGIAMYQGSLTGAPITGATITSTSTVPGWVPNVSALANRTDGTKGATAVICAKCHDLENLSSASGVVEGANTAHDSHHQDQLDGSSQCVNCHIAIPHGWKMPRLLVNTAVDVAPYVDAKLVGILEAGAPNKIGMEGLSGVNNHPLGPATGHDPYSSGNGAAVATLNLGHVGLAYWDESQCLACDDHGNDSRTPRIVVPSGLE
jgi:hypothetical protein